MRFLAAGESALVVELGNAIAPELNARVLALDRAPSLAPLLAATRLSGAADSR